MRVTQSKRNLISRRQFNDRRKFTANLCEQIRKNIALAIDAGESTTEQAADSIEAHMDDFDRYEPNQLPDSTSIDSSIDTSNGVLEITEEDLQNI